MDIRNDLGLDALDFLAALQEAQNNITQWDKFFQLCRENLDKLSASELEILTALAKQKTAEVQRAVLALTPAEGTC